MASYVIADIHGEYDLFLRMLERIRLQEEDTLYILGDVVDRGPHPVKVLCKLMEMPNVIPIVGNHELMALDGLRFLNREITEESVRNIDRETLAGLADWMRNGSEPTMREFREQDPETRQEIIDFILQFSLYEEVEAGGERYLLVHAGLGDYVPGKDIEDYSLKNLVWDRAEYDIRYFEDRYVVSGHTPTQLIEGNPRPGYIYRANGHIAIDCGCCFTGGRLAAIRLDDGEEFYVERDET
ncbi:MAG: fructose-bisphosphatase class III [Lachnospiraceae bacterium]|nr:fructose-bisphosphatase class III [Lachnospiraceae bacterium]